MTTGEDYTEEQTKGVQSAIYSYAYKNRYGELPEITYSVMNKKKVEKSNYRPQIIKIKRTEEDLDQLLITCKEFYDNVTEDKFEPTKGNHCFWCSFRSSCKYK